MANAIENREMTIEEIEKKKEVTEGELVIDGMLAGAELVCSGIGINNTIVACKQGNVGKAILNSVATICSLFGYMYYATETIKKSKEHESLCKEIIKRN